MPINQYTATTGRKKQSGAVDTINALAPGYVSSLYTRASNALTEKGLKLTDDQNAETAAFNKATLAEERRAREAAESNAKTANLVSGLGLGVQAAQLLPASITNPITGALKAVAGKAYDLFGEPLVAGAKSLLGIAPTAASSIGLGGVGATLGAEGLSVLAPAAASALAPTLGLEGLSLLAPATAAAAEGIGLGTGILEGGKVAAMAAKAAALPAEISLLAPALPTTFAGGLSTAVSSILAGTTPSVIAGSLGSVGAAATLGVLAPALPIAAAVYAFGQIMDQVLGSDPTKPFRPEQVGSAGKNVTAWNDQAGKMGIPTVNPSVPMTAENFAYWDSPAGHAEFRTIQQAMQKTTNRVIGTANPDNASADALTNLAKYQTEKTGTTNVPGNVLEAAKANPMTIASSKSSALDALRDIKF